MDTPKVTIIFGYTKKKHVRSGALATSSPHVTAYNIDTCTKIPSETVTSPLEGKSTQKKDHL